MRTTSATLALCATALVTGCSALSKDDVPNLAEEEIRYSADGVTMHGYLVYDREVTGPRPGVLVVHEWWGHNDYARKRARMLAAMGYTALAVDMYGDGKQAAHPEDASAFASAVMQDMAGAKARFDAARATLEEHASTDSDKTAAIGYCFGGAVVLNMACAGEDLDVVGSFHGSLPQPEGLAPGQVKAKVFVAHGADDPFITAEQIEGFRSAMDAAAADLTFEAYPGAVHSFTNPDADTNGEKFELPLRYDASADAKSWSRLCTMLREQWGA